MGKLSKNWPVEVKVGNKLICEPSLRLALATLNYDLSFGRIAADADIILVHLLRFIAGDHIGQRHSIGKGEAVKLVAFLESKGLWKWKVAESSTSILMMAQ